MDEKRYVYFYCIEKRYPKTIAHGSFESYPISSSNDYIITITNVVLKELDWRLEDVVVHAFNCIGIVEE